VNAFFRDLLQALVCASILGLPFAIYIFQGLNYAQN
jgi:hypothetical protein